MKDKMFHLRISEDLMKRYRMICLELDISPQKQSAKLIENFVNIQEENCLKLKATKNKGR